MNPLVSTVLASGGVEGLFRAMGAPAFLWFLATLELSMMYWLAAGAISWIILGQFRWSAWVLPGLRRVFLALVLLLLGSGLLAATGGFSGLLGGDVLYLVAALLLITQILVWMAFLWRWFGRQISKGCLRTALSALIAGVVLLPFDVIYVYLSVFTAELTWGYLQWIWKGT